PGEPISPSLHPPRLTLTAVNTLVFKVDALCDDAHTPPSTVALGIAIGCAAPSCVKFTPSVEYEPVQLLPWSVGRSRMGVAEVTVDELTALLPFRHSNVAPPAGLTSRSAKNAPAEVSARIITPALAAGSVFAIELSRAVTVVSPVIA